MMTLDGANTDTNNAAILTPRICAKGSGLSMIILTHCQLAGGNRYPSQRVRCVCYRHHAGRARRAGEGSNLNRGGRKLCGIIIAAAGMGSSRGTFSYQ